MADEQDTSSAIRSGVPEPDGPVTFFLDPGYHGTLGSDAFRHRFANLVAMPRNIPAYGCYAIFFAMIFCVTPLGIFAYNRDLEFLAGCSASAFMVWGLIGYFAWVWSKGWRYERRMRRLAWKGQLVSGSILLARRTRQTIPGSDFTEGDDAYDIVALEIEYQARTPAGLRVQGSNLFRRDDLLNAELPAAGTPVWVLVLDATTHAVL